MFLSWTRLSRVFSWNVSCFACVAPTTKPTMIGAFLSTSPSPRELFSLPKLFARDPRSHRDHRTSFVLVAGPLEVIYVAWRALVAMEFFGRRENCGMMNGGDKNGCCEWHIDKYLRNYWQL